jgi:hypothetical protein
VTWGPRASVTATGELSLWSQPANLGRRAVEDYWDQLVSAKAAMPPAQ